MTDIRVGVLTDDAKAAAWKVDLIERIAGESGVALILTSALGKVAGQLRRKSSPLLFRCWEQLDAKLNKSAARTLAHIPIARSDNAELCQIGSQNLDVLIDLREPGVRSRAERFLDACARFGVWRLVLGDEGKHEPLYREQTEGSPVFPVELQSRHAATDKVLERTYCTIDPLSITRSRAMAWVSGSKLLLRALRRLRDQGSGALEGKAICAPRRAPAVAKGTDLAENLKLALFFARVAAGWLQKATRFYQWRTAIAVRPPRLSAVACLMQGAFRPIEYSLDRFYADPFLFEHEGETFLFAELLIFAERKGVVVVSRLDEQGRPGPFEVVLEEAFHLSFPFVFRDGDDIFMLPEQSEAGKVQLYRCEAFPAEWKPDAILLEEPGLDTICFVHEGRWWMMTSLAGDGKFPAQPELHLYFADLPRGPWQPHPKNPIVSDVRKARSAGRLIQEGGSLLRPAQDCTLVYGHGISWHRIEKLTTEEYVEVELSTLLGEDCAWQRNAVGTHSYDETERFCVTDALVRPLRAARWLSPKRSQKKPDLPS